MAAVGAAACGDPAAEGNPTPDEGSTGGPVDGDTGGSTAPPSVDSSTTEDPGTAGVTTQPEPVCGNGILESIEECDDGNRVDGDGCDGDCMSNLDTNIWQTTHGGDAMVAEAGQGIAVDSVGNIVVGGYEVDAVGNPNMWLAKYDPDGAQIWEMSLDPSGGMDDRIYGVAIGPADAIVAVGDVDVAPTSSDVWVAMFDPNGAPLWNTSIDGPTGADDGGRGVATDTDGNVVVTGYLRTGANDNDIFVSKFSAAGAPMWSDTVAGPSGLDDRGQGVGTDTDGNVVVAGFVGDEPFDRDVWLRKYDPDGGELWTTTWDSPNGLDDAGFGLAVAADGSLAVTGMTPVVADNQDVWLGRFDPDGELTWLSQFGGQSFINDQGLAVAADSVGSLIVAGFRGVSATDSDIWMRKYDMDGNVLWSQFVAGDGADRDQARAVATDANDDIVVTGEIRNVMSNDGDVWIAKFGPG